MEISRITLLIRSSLLSYMIHCNNLDEEIFLLTISPFPGGMGSGVAGKLSFVFPFPISFLILAVGSLSTPLIVPFWLLHAEIKRAERNIKNKRRFIINQIPFYKICIYYKLTVC